MIEHEPSSGNVFADLGFTNATEMLVKAQLASKIGEIIKQRKWTQQQACEVLGVPQGRLSQILRGQFRGVSEAKLIDCLIKLGRDVQIVVSKPKRQARSAQLQVVFQG